MFYYIKKIHERKEEHPSPYFYKDNCEHKKRKMFAHNMYSTNIKETKKYLGVKGRKSNCDVDDDTDNCSPSHMTKEKICSIVPLL